MKNNFKELLESMLVQLDEGISVEEIIAAKMKETNLSKESQSKVKEVVVYVEQLENAMHDLATAREKGASREEWLEDRIDKITQSLPEELQEKANDVLEKASNKYFENID